MNSVNCVIYSKKFNTIYNIFIIIIFIIIFIIYCSGFCCFTAPIAMPNNDDMLI